MLGSTLPPSAWGPSPLGYPASPSASAPGTYAHYALPTSSTASAMTMTHRWLVMPQASSTVGNAVFASTQFWHVTGAGGYIGTQSWRLSKTSETHRAIFSCWDEPPRVTGWKDDAISNANCARFGGEGVGSHCLIDVSLRENTTYTLTYRAAGGNASGAFWEGIFTSPGSTGVTIGTLFMPSLQVLVPGYGPLQVNAASFQEYFLGGGCDGTTTTSGIALGGPTFTAVEPAGAAASTAAAAMKKKVIVPSQAMASYAKGCEEDDVTCSPQGEACSVPHVYLLAGGTTKRTTTEGQALWPSKPMSASEDTTTTIVVNLSTVAFTTSPNYLSVAIDGYGLMGSKWPTFARALSSKPLLALTKALAPAYVRMGGTANDFVVFNTSTAGDDPPPSGGGGAACPGAGGDPSASPSHRVYRPSTPYAMSACQWGSVLRWAEAAGLQMLFGLNCLSNRSRHGPKRSCVGPWDPSNALALVAWTKTHFPSQVAGWELGNEPEGWIRNFGMNITAEQHLADYITLRKALPSGFLVGPDYGIQGCVHESSDRCTSFDKIVSLLGATDPPLVDISTFHYYDLSHNAKPPDTADMFVEPWVLDRNKEALGLAVKANREAAHAAPVWIGEGATASGGGIPNASGTYSATFLWLDKLGATGRFGGSGLMRQSLFSGTYGLLDPNTFVPRPTYWIAALWKQLIGGATNVLSVGGDDVHNRTQRVYARCGKRAGSYVVFGSSLSTAPTSLRFAAPLGLSASRTDFILTGELGGPDLFLNGKPMAADAATGGAPEFAGQTMQAGAALELPALSSFFTVLTGVGGSSVCSSPTSETTFRG